MFGVKLTAAAASAGEPGADVPVAPTVPICPRDRLKGATPVVVNVSPRMGDASAEPASGRGAEDGRERLVADPGRDCDVAEVEVRQFQHQVPQPWSAAVVGQSEGGQRQTAIGRRLGLDGVEFDERSRARPERRHRRRHVGLLRGGEHGRHQQAHADGDDSHTKVRTARAAAGGDGFGERRSPIATLGMLRCAATTTDRWYRPSTTLASRSDCACWVHVGQRVPLLG